VRISGSDREYELIQWGNDWISTLPLAENSPFDKQGKWVIGVVSQRRVLLNAREIEILTVDREHAQEAFAEGHTPITGTFWRQWELRTSRLADVPGHPLCGWFGIRKGGSNATGANS